MLFVVDHDVCPISHLSQGVDSLKVLLGGGVEVHKGVHYHVVRCPLAAFLPRLAEHLEPWQHHVFVLVPVPSEMHLLQFALGEHLCLLLGHEADVQSLVDVQPRFAIDELLKERLPLFAGE